MRSIVFTLLLLIVLSTTTAQGIKFDTVLIVNKQSFRIAINPFDDYRALMSSTTGEKTDLIDTIYTRGISDIEFPDFDEDGNVDIMTSYIGNNPIYFLYLFDLKVNRFKRVENFSSFPNAVRIKSNTKLYYSYHRAGCADANWVSDLFRIDNFKIIHLGHIYGQSCELASQVIDVYKVKNNEQKHQLLEKLPYSKVVSDSISKWDFIKDYWNKNYKKFE